MPLNRYVEFQRTIKLSIIVLKKWCKQDEAHYDMENDDSSDVEEAAM